MRLLKEHLSAYNYSWINEAAFTGEASRRLLGLKIEDRLMNQLPVDAKSEISVLNWLKQIPPLPVSNAY